MGKREKGAKNKYNSVAYVGCLQRDACMVSRKPTKIIFHKDYVGALYRLHRKEWHQWTEKGDFVDEGVMRKNTCIMLRKSQHVAGCHDFDFMKI